MKFNSISKLDLFEIEQLAANVEGEERKFYYKLYNKVLELRRQESLRKAIESGYDVTSFKDDIFYVENKEGILEYTKEELYEKRKKRKDASTTHIGKTII